MAGLKKLPDRGDPSDILQLFPKLNFELLCCRYWWLKRWEFRELAFPYWRIYYNRQKGATIVSNGNTYDLEPDKIYLIPPNTSYSTSLFGHPIPATGYSLEGNRIETGRTSDFEEGKIVEHLFIHFNIGMPYDNLTPGIFVFEMTSHMEEKIWVITNHLKIDSSQINFYVFLAIQSLIGEILSKIDNKYWELITKDFRILNTINFIETNIDQDLSNVVLSGNCNLATNAFARLFKEEVGVSPQHFIRQKRINNACALLHHTDDSLEEIAVKTGFTNRYHFTRIFKQVTGLSPARYRKEFRIR